MTRTRRAVIGIVLPLLTLVRLSCGGSAGRAPSAWSGQHMVAVAPDLNAIMATGACAPGSGGG